MLRLTWTENALKDLDWWQEHDIKMLRKIIQLCLDICKNPFMEKASLSLLNMNFKVIGQGASTMSIALFTLLMKVK